ncbi:hypothetical protein BGZ54_005220 [Gamsiella multidivaricata]|nr:hypothetical protein BGZ54_005220 [Gamsiella multidivaricata]
MQDYPIFITGNPPDLVRLAMEFGHVPFIDHLLHRGFRPRNLPEYFSLIPSLPVETSTNQLPGDGKHSGNRKSGWKRADGSESQEQGGSRNNRTLFLRRSLELNQIWECMRLTNQELVDACARADLDAVRKVLDATLVRPRPTLDGVPSTNSLDFDAEPTSKARVEEKHRHANYGTEPAAQILEDESLLMSSPGIASSSSDRYPVSLSLDPIASASGHDDTQENSAEVQDDAFSSTPIWTAPAAVHRSTIFTTRPRVDSDSIQDQHHSSDRTSSPLPRPECPEPYQHMPWVDGRALTGALLAVCFRRDGYGSEEAEGAEESKTVPIVNEILKYDCMLTAQSLGQAVLGLAYSRPAGALKRASEMRQKSNQGQEQHGRGHSSPSTSFWSSSSQPESTSQRNRALIRDKDVNSGLSIMNLLMERIGPREWLKLIKYYLQRQAFEDLSIILDICPFKGPQLEVKVKDTENDFHPYKTIRSQYDYRRQQARELICRETGICGMGSRLGHFSGRGIGQGSYNVSATLHDSSRILFTGSGTRFTSSYMLPRGGFRGIGGNTNGSSSSVGYNGGQGAGSVESLTATDESSHQDTQALEVDHHFNSSLPLGLFPQDFRQESQQSQQRSPAGTDLALGAADMEEESAVEEDMPMNMNQELLDTQDPSLAFGGVGSSTTSSSRPGPGIVGIAVQAQAPDHILRALLKLGFRFFSICDLSISESRHPLALQFRQQEKMNRQLIDFCMVPNTGSPSEPDTNLLDMKGKKRIARKRDDVQDEIRYDIADQEYHVQAVEKFLYPAASNPAQGSVSTLALPAHILDLNSDNPGCISEQRPSVIIASTATAEEDVGTDTDSTGLMVIREPALAQVSTSTLSLSNHLEFVLPPMSLGETFESGAPVTEFPDQMISPSPSLQVPFDPSQYRMSEYAKPMSLSTRKSMLEARSISGSNFATIDLSSYRGFEIMGSGQEGASPTSISYQQMINDTTRRRVHECLSSEYIDLMTVGICLYQACYHQKEVLLRALLEHRLLIAQDALAGAVQVAASVGWKHGLEILLMEHGDMEAEVDPVVTMTSEHAHHGTSMKWDYATAAPLNPGRKNENIGLPRSLDMLRGGLEIPSADGFEETLGGGHCRYQSDSSGLNWFSSHDGNGQGSNNSRDMVGGVGEGIAREPRQLFEIRQRTSLNVSHRPIFPDRRSSSAAHVPVWSLLGPITPTARSSSLGVRLSTFLPSLTASKKAKRQERSSDKCKISATEPLQQDNVQLRQKSQPALLMLSASALWSLPSVMTQRKNRNAVIALMAATTRNDPSLVRWIIESFADIKIVHLMQALVIACDRGLIRVVRVLVGNSAVDRAAKAKSKSTGNHAPRLLFRCWLALQYQKITETTLSGPGTQASEYSQQRLNSFPFIFLMESSPIFRYYYQTLNTLSSCLFMNRKGSIYRKAPSTANNISSSASEGPSTSSHPNAFTSPEAAPPSPSRLHRRQQQPSSSYSSIVQLQLPSKQQQQQRVRTRPRSPQEVKHKIIRIMLEPILETFGPISFRKALDRMPRDCWWPLDHDVRLIADQEARTSMIAIATTMKQQTKERQQGTRVYGSGQEHSSEFTEKDTIVAEISAEGRRKESWHRVAGQRFRQWVVVRKKTSSTDQALSHSESCDEKVEGTQGTRRGSRSFFRWLGFVHGST